MIGLKEAKAAFFDAKKVIAATTKAQRRVLSRFGAFVRRTAKSSIRKRKRAAEEGKPPSSHTGILKKFLFFAYSPASQSVVIGPVRLGGKIGDAPRALEHGGRSKARRRERGRRVVRAIQLKPHPFMGPAFEKEQPKLPALWRDSIRP